jgi:alpha-L-rhamnosidase
LLAPAGPPVRRIEEIRPVAILQTPGGDTVVDMGQNMVGRVRLRVRGNAGQTVTLRHAEMLDREGNFYTDNLRAASQRVQYTLAGQGDEVYEAHFTFQGFRYVAVDGYPSDLTLESLTGMVIHSDMPVTGRFQTSNPLINQLQHNIEWGQKGNFLDVPTDCPQRDERMGWTGDAQVFARTAAYNMDVAGFFTKWLGDVAADQKDSGSIPWVVPDVLGHRIPNAHGATGWADAAVVIPWTMYLTYGDTRILESQYSSMQAWLGYVRERAGEDLIWEGDFHFGDWLSYSTDNADYPGATTDTDLIATAYFAFSARLVQKTADVLGKTADAAEYEDLVRQITDAFQSEFITRTGRMASNTQTAYALALAFDLMPHDQRAQATDRLAADVRKFGNHLTTGFLGTPLLSATLTENGRVDVAYDLILQETYPSWLYPVKMGATTIWERWDGIRPDSTFQNPGMNSFNHYAYGAVGDWLYRVVAGVDLDPLEPAYRHVHIRPQPGGGLTSAAGSLQTMYGEVESAWSIDDGRFTLNLTVPPNSRATIRLPGAAGLAVTEAGLPLSQVEAVTERGIDKGARVVSLGSGRYAFEYSAEALVSDD